MYERGIKKQKQLKMDHDLAEIERKVEEESEDGL